MWLKFDPADKNEVFQVLDSQHIKYEYMANDKEVKDHIFAHEALKRLAAKKEAEERERKTGIHCASPLCTCGHCEGE